MINKLRNDFIDRFDMNNFYMGILFIILSLILMYTLNFDFNKYKIFELLLQKFEKSIMETNIIESIILVFIINIIGYLVNFFIKSVYNVHSFFLTQLKRILKFFSFICNKFFSFICNKFFSSKYYKFLKVIAKFRKEYYKFLKIISKFKTKNNISISVKLINIALFYNPSLLNVKLSKEIKQNMIELYLTIFMQSKDEHLYRQFIHRVKKNIFYHNAISLIFLFLLIIFTFKFIFPAYIEYTINNPSSVNQKVYSKNSQNLNIDNTINNNESKINLEELAFHFLLVIIILTISIHIPYIQHKKEMQTELLVFIELLNTKLQNNNL